MKNRLTVLEFVTVALFFTGGPEEKKKAFAVPQVALMLKDLPYPVNL